MSDRPVELPSLDTRMDDVRAVLDAVESERAVLFANGDGGFLGTVFAATYPEQTAGLILFNSLPRRTRGPDTPWLRTRAEAEESIQSFLRAWGNLDEMAKLMKDAHARETHDELVEEARRARLSHSPAAVAAYLLPTSISTSATSCPRSGSPRSSCTGLTPVFHTSRTRAISPSTSPPHGLWSCQAWRCPRPGRPRGALHGARTLPQRVRRSGESRDRSGPCAGDDLVHRPRGRHRPCFRARRSPLARTPREAPSAHPNSVGVLPRKGDGHSRRWVLRDLRRPGPGDSLRVCHSGRRSRTRPRDPGGASHRGMRTHERQGRRDRRPHRGASCISRTTRRSSRLSNRQRSRRRFRTRPRRARRGGAERRPRQMGALRGHTLRSLAPRTVPTHDDSCRVAENRF